MNWAQNQRRQQPALPYLWRASVKVPQMKKAFFFFFFNILHMTGASQHVANMQSFEGLSFSQIHQRYNDCDTVGKL